MTVRRRYDPWMPGAVRDSDGGLSFEPTVLLHAEEAYLLRPVLESFVVELHKGGAMRKLDRIGPVAARWRHLADWYATELAGALHDASADGTPSGAPARSEHEWITTREAADVLDVSPQWIRELLGRGELTGYRRGRMWLVSAASVSDYESSRAA